MAGRAEVRYGWSRMSAKVAAILEKLTDVEKVELFGILIQQVPDELISPNRPEGIEGQQRVIEGEIKSG